MADSKGSIVLSVLSLVVAIGSAGFSYWSLRETHLTDFRPELLVGDPIVKAESALRPATVVLLVPINLFNDGAKSGCIEDLRIAVRPADVRFYPAAFINYAEFRKAKVDAKGSGVPLPAYTESRFMPIFVEGKKSVLKHVLFVPRRPVSVQMLGPGAWTVDLTAWRCGSGGAIDVIPQEYMIRKEDLAAIGRGFEYPLVRKATVERRGG